MFDNKYIYYYYRSSKNGRNKKGSPHKKSSGNAGNVGGNAGNVGSQATKRIVHSGKLTFEASYEELPECFHVGHNPSIVYPSEIRRAIHNVKFIHSHMIQADKFDEVSW